MMGYKVEIGSDENKAYSFTYVEKIEKVIEWISNSLEFDFTQANLTERDIHIKAIEVKECNSIKGCKNLIPVDEGECLRCDKIKFDCSQEHKEQLEEEARLRE